MLAQLLFGFVFRSALEIFDLQITTVSAAKNEAK